MKNKFTKLALTAILCISLFFSCTTDIALPPPPPEPPSSSAEQTWDYCVYPEIQQCFPGSYSACPGNGGLLGNVCPYSSSSYAQSSSDGVALSSGGVAVSSSSSIAGQSSSIETELSSNSSVIQSSSSVELSSSSSSSSIAVVVVPNSSSRASITPSSSSTASIGGTGVSPCPSDETRGNMCLWEGGCWPLEGQRASCAKNAWIFQGGKEGSTDCSRGTFICGKNNNPPTNPTTPFGCCKWETETKCWDVYTAQEKEYCSSGGGRFWNQSCPDEKGGCPN